MSISEDEAEKAYSTEYWNDGSGCKKVFAANTDDLQEAYIRGREAPPSDVEVEAVAKRLLWRSCKKWDGIESDYVAKDEDDAWDYAGEICGYIAVLRRGRRKPSEKPPVGKKKAKASKKPVKLTAEQLARKREHTRQWRMAHREQVLEYNRRYKLAHRPTFHHFSREEQAAYERNYYLLQPEKRKRKRETV